MPISVGSWELVDMKACNLPEDVATGFSDVTQGLVGAKYTPVLYVGKQIVQGVNHMIICEQTLATGGAPKHLVRMVLNSAIGGAWSIVSIEQIV